MLGCRMYARDSRSSAQEDSRGNIDEVANKVAIAQDLASSGGAFYLA